VSPPVATWPWRESAARSSLLPSGQLGRQDDGDGKRARIRELDESVALGFELVDGAGHDPPDPERVEDGAGRLTHRDLGGVELTEVAPMTDHEDHRDLARDAERRQSVDAVPETAVLHQQRAAAAGEPRSREEPNAFLLTRHGDDAALGIDP